MKKLQIVLGENEAQITMEFSEYVAARFFKEMSDKMFAEKYSIESIQIDEAVDEVVEQTVDEVVEDNSCDTNMEELMGLVDASIKAMEHKKEVDDRLYHLNTEKPNLVLMRCNKCGGKFYSKSKKGDNVVCKCGSKMDTDKTFVKGVYDCKKCMSHFVFYADESIDAHNTSCPECGNHIKLKFDEKRYSLNNY